MTITLRIILFVVSVLHCAWIIQRIRKSKVKIEDSIFWILFSGLLVCMSIFPQLMEWGAAATGVQSTVNFVFLIIIFVLMTKLFQLTVKLSQMESKLQAFAQTYAIDKLNAQKKSNAEKMDKDDMASIEK